MLCGVWSVRGAGGKAKLGWEGGCPASIWAEFRGMWWSVVKGIADGFGVGFWLASAVDFGDLRWFCVVE